MGYFTGTPNRSAALDGFWLVFLSKGAGRSAVLGFKANKLCLSLLLTPLSSVVCRLRGFRVPRRLAPCCRAWLRLHAFLTGSRGSCDPAPAGARGVCQGVVTTCFSVSEMNPRLHLSPNMPAAAPMAQAPEYHKGARILGRSSSCASRFSHQARWVCSSRAELRICCLVVSSRAVNSCPW